MEGFDKYMFKNLLNFIYPCNGMGHEHEVVQRILVDFDHGVLRYGDDG